LNLEGWLGSLERSSLERLEEALRSGEVGPGSGEARLRARRLPAAWAGPLQALSEAGWSGAQLSLAVGWALRERARAEEARWQLISTHAGAAAEGFVDTPVALRRLFEQAQREVLLAGFRVTERPLLEHLRRPAGRRLLVEVFVDLSLESDAFGRSLRGRRPAVEAWPGEWWGQFVREIWPEAMEAPQGWYSPLTLTRGEDGAWRSMHIKAVVVDRRWWLLTSANFTDRGQYRNLELGLLLEDARLAEGVLAHFEAMKRQGVFVPLG
jgi:phosphatidylserine/phosphatidylglycerophosphate/cardiolipin synthase-like enzyme